jgi:hypothetical protein
MVASLAFFRHVIDRSGRSGGRFLSRLLRLVNLLGRGVLRFFALGFDGLLRVVRLLLHGLGGFFIAAGQGEPGRGQNGLILSSFSCEVF